MTEGEGVRVEMTRFASGGMTEECDFPSAMWAGLAKKNGVDTSGRRIPVRLVARLISCEGCGERAVFQVTVHEREEENKREDMPLSHESRVIRVAAFRLKGGSGGNLLGEGDNQRAQRSGARL
jgi:hypothetical protein